MSKTGYFLTFMVLFCAFYILMPEKGSFNAKPNAAAGEIGHLANALNSFSTDAGRYPATSESLQVLIERPQVVPANRWRGPYLKDALGKNLVGVMPDPWGNPYRYELTPSRPHGAPFEITSAGRDGTFGTKDDMANYQKGLPSAYNVPLFYHLKAKFVFTRY